MTLLQMTGMYQAIANDGVRIPPLIVKATIAPDGTRTEEPRPGRHSRGQRGTARALRNMFRPWSSVTRWALSRAPVRLPRSRVSGGRQTGTAQQINPACGCYYDDVYWITFAGMAPAEDPALRHRDHDGRAVP